ncbi:MAG: hypothetical protein WD273_07965 [Trueperaceae bacterium]
MTSRAFDLEGISVLLLDALDDMSAEHSDFVLVSGAHAGLDSARRVLRRPPQLAVFNDAGVGKDRAGIAGLELLDAFHIPAAAVDVNSARIGDAADTLENGVITHYNKLAQALGVEVGDSVREVLTKLER